MRAYVPVRLLVVTIRVLDLVERVFLERGLYPVQDIKDVMLFWSGERFGMRRRARGTSTGGEAGRDSLPWAEARGKVEGAVLLGDERVEDVGEELDDRGALGIAGGEGEPELQYRVGVVTCTAATVSMPDVRLGREPDGPWWTKKTASQTMRLSGEGITYMPRGQCAACRRDAYSSETAVRVRAEVASSEMLPPRVLWR